MHLYIHEIKFKVCLRIIQWLFPIITSYNGLKNSNKGRLDETQFKGPHTQIETDSCSTRCQYNLYIAPISLPNALSQLYCKYYWESLMFFWHLFSIFSRCCLLYWMNDKLLYLGSICIFHMDKQQLVFEIYLTNDQGTLGYPFPQGHMKLFWLFMQLIERYDK